MGFSFRKSIGIKGLKINLSKSGVSVSTGVKGARVVKRLNDGKTTFYGQKSVGGVNLRYIKSDTPKKDNAKSQKIRDTPDGISCNNCHKQIEPNSKFCKHCGSAQNDVNFEWMSAIEEEDNGIDANPFPCMYCNGETEFKERIILKDIHINVTYCRPCQEIQFTKSVNILKRFFNQTPEDRELEIERMNKILQKAEEDPKIQKIMKEVTAKWFDYS